MLVLGLETSCDDTAAAILKGNNVLSTKVATLEVHKKYGGVVPELASREHQKNIIPVVDIAIKKETYQTFIADIIDLHEICISQLLAAHGRQRIKSSASAYILPS